MSIRDSLAATGVVRFSFNGQIASVSGIPIGGPIQFVLRLNGRVIPQTLLTFPVQRFDTVAIELFFSVTGRADEEDKLQQELTDIAHLNVAEHFATYDPEEV
ncbi:hypothetical protein EV294_106107 [Paenibacillus sp. BK033]|uniref:hypothetical protein n=2 Tax=unclassified Paenibacillus TaxID=185978 RepID=UPI0010D837AD|nr:hypothetical protein [Paenibacillus sp. BK033]TCM95739.1 hypothetical protein EV294_106107 [Paenibacillus sp. BK033]